MKQFWIFSSSLFFLSASSANLRAAYPFETIQLSFKCFFFSENVRPYKATGMETLCLFYNLFKTPFSPKFTKKAFLKHFFFRDKDRWVSTAVYVFLEPRNRTCVSQQRISLLRLKRENIDGTCHDDAPPECRYAPLPLPYLGTSPALGEH